MCVRLSVYPLESLHFGALFVVVVVVVIVFCYFLFLIFSSP